MKPLITLTEAISDVDLLGGPFKSPSFWTWKVVAKLIDGIPLTEPREIELFEQATGRKYNRWPRRAVRRLIILAGRRAGKDRFESAVAVWRSALCQDWSKHTSAGEGAVTILLGADKKQAAILRRYCEGLLKAKRLAPEVVRSTGELIEFRNGATLEIISNDARLVRGRSAIAVLGSEASHWRTNEYSSSSDEEVVGAAEPSMAMCPDGGLLILGSSVHRKAGFMYRKYRQLFANDDSDDLVWFAASTVMNPKLPISVIDKALAEDAPRARAEYLNIWREDLSDFIPLDIIESCTDFGIHERPPVPSVTYTAYCDPAGGTGSDSFSIAIVHRVRDKIGTVKLDLVHERKPRFVPAAVIAEYANVLRSYRITEICGDKFAGGFHSDEWQRNGIRFKACENTTSGNYLFALPMLLSARARLLDSLTLRNQLAGLERKVTPTGHEQVTHDQHSGAHDDLATSVCGELVTAGTDVASNYFANLDVFTPGYIDRDKRGDAPTPAESPEAKKRHVRLFG